MILQTEIPTNLWTVGGAVAALAGVIVFLFKLLNDSNEKRLNETKDNLNKQIETLRKELDEEKLQRKELSNKIETLLLNDKQKLTELTEKAITAIDKNSELLAKLR